MKKRLASLFLLLVLPSSALAGVPLQFGESECSMRGMMNMDCCKAARLQKETSNISEAELFCALSCAQNGTTLPTSAVRVMPVSQVRNASHPAITQPLPYPSFLFLRIDRWHGPPVAAAPTYLRNLALLI